MLLEATEWKWMPTEGGILDQPDWLLEDLSKIAQRVGYIESREKAGKVFSGIAVAQRRKP